MYCNSQFLFFNASLIFPLTFAVSIVMATSNGDKVERHDWIPDGFKLSIDDIKFELSENGQRKTIGWSLVCDVYEGTVNKNGKRVGCAVKMYRYDASNRDPFLRQLQNEVKLLHLALGVEYVSRFLGVLVPTSAEEKQNNERFAVVTELVKGSTLKERHEGKQATSPHEVVAVMLQIARAMEYLHVTRIRHLDLSPNNIKYVTDEMGTEKRNEIKLLDLGHSRLQHAATSSSGMSSTILVDKRHGTVGYRAPEILRGGGANSKSDVFSFGCVMYFMVYGKAPFVKLPSDIGFADEEELMQGLWPTSTVSGDFKYIIEQCWLPEPLGRPSFRLIKKYLNSLLTTTISASPQPSRDSSTYPLSGGKSFAFISEVDRLGSHSEKEHCKVIAGQLACDEQVLTTKDYQTKEDFMSELERGARWCSSAEFAVFIFSAHGFEGHLQIGKDIFVPVHETLEQLARECKSDQMKLVLFNKCRGLPSGHQDISDVRSYHDPPNLHVCSATTAGGSAWRSEEDGALFLRAICDVAASMEGDRLYHLFPKVREALRKQAAQLTQEVSTLEPEWVDALLPVKPVPAQQRPLCEQTPMASFCPPPPATRGESRNPAADLLQLFSLAPPSWDVSNLLESWEGITVGDNQEVIKISLRSEGPVQPGTTVKWEVLGSFRELRTLILEVGFAGKVNFRDLPNSLQHLHLNDNSFGGSVDLTQLPPGLLSLHLGGNGLSGPVDLTRLPVHLESLRLHGNNFSGSVDLSVLPPHLACLWLHGNRFSESVDLCQLPKGLRALWLENNKLSGPLDFSNLPPELRSLHLNHNAFCGKVAFNHLPRHLKVFWLHSNQFSGVLKLSTLPDDLLDLGLGENRFSGQVDLTVLPACVQEVRLHNNRLDGVVDLTGLPTSLKFLRLDGNSFERFIGAASVQRALGAGFRHR